MFSCKILVLLLAFYKGCSINFSRVIRLFLHYYRASPINITLKVNKIVNKPINITLKANKIINKPINITLKVRKIILIRI